MPVEGGEEPSVQTLLELNWCIQEELVERHGLSREVEQKSSVYPMILTILMEHPTLQPPSLNPRMCVVGNIFTLHAGPISSVYQHTVPVVYATIPLGHQSL